MHKSLFVSVKEAGEQFGSECQENNGEINMWYIAIVPNIGVYFN